MKTKLMTTLGLLLLVTLIVPAACSSKSAVLSDATSTRGGVPSVAPQPATPPGFAASKESAVGNGGVTAVSDTRMIVHNGDMSLIVRSVTDARDQIVSLTERFEGFVVSSYVSGENEQMRGSISIRVPDTKFEQARTEIGKLAVRVELDSTNSQDVTQQYTDLQARLKNAQATENQYLALLSQAKNVDETLRVYEALSRIRLEIEQIKGQMQYLERTTSMSLISIQLRPQGSGSALVKPGWSALETMKSAIRSLVTLGQGLVNVLIWILLFLPVWGTILGVILWRINRRRRMQQP